MSDNTDMPVPVTREDMYLASLTKTSDVELPIPVTREDMYLASLCGMKIENLPTPITRKEVYLSNIAESGGIGGQPVVIGTIDTSTIVTVDLVCQNAVAETKTGTLAYTGGLETVSKISNVSNAVSTQIAYTPPTP